MTEMFFNEYGVSILIIVDSDNVKDEHFSCTGTHISANKVRLWTHTIYGLSHFTTNDSYTSFVVMTKTPNAHGKLCLDLYFF